MGALRILVVCATILGLYFLENGMLLLSFLSVIAIAVCLIKIESLSYGKDSE